MYTLQNIDLPVATVTVNARLNDLRAEIKILPLVNNFT